MASARECDRRVGLGKIFWWCEWRFIPPNPRDAGRHVHCRRDILFTSLGERAGLELGRRRLLVCADRRGWKPPWPGQYRRDTRRHAVGLPGVARWRVDSGWRIVVPDGKFEKYSQFQRAGK